MIKICECCGCQFQTRKSKPLCPVCRDKARLKSRQDRERIQILCRLKVDESIGKPTKTLDDWCREAAECNLDYGTYRSIVELHGKTFDELRTQNQNRSVTHHAQGHHSRSIRDD